MRGFRGLWVTFFTLFFALGAAADVDGEEGLRKHSHSGKDSRKKHSKKRGTFSPAPTTGPTHSPTQTPSPVIRGLLWPWNTVCGDGSQN